MILSDRDIRDRLQRTDDSRIVIDPYPKDEAFQPASIDLTLSGNFLFFAGSDKDLIDPCKDYPTDPWDISYAVELMPQELLLGSTLESVHIPSDLVAIVDGKSTLGRLGLLVHITAGFIDPGFHGNITLELFNVNSNAIVLRTGMHICQIRFETLSSAARRIYGSKELGSRYQNSVGTVGPKVS